MEIAEELLRRLDEKDARIKELTDLMLRYTGVIQSDVRVEVPEAPSATPLGKRWNRIKPILENKFSKMAEEAGKELEDASVNG